MHNKHPSMRIILLIFIEIESFNADIPSFASFSETLASQRSKQSNLLKLEGVEINSESDKQALESLGIVVNSDSN